MTDEQFWQDARELSDNLDSYPDEIIEAHDMENIRAINSIRRRYQNEEEMEKVDIYYS